MTPTVRTADLCDAFPDRVQVVAPDFRAFGGHAAMAGAVRTVQAYGDNSKVREALAEPGRGSVLVVDGGGARTWALLGDRLAQSAVDQGWAGVVVYGCIRDAEAIAAMPIGVWALGTHPRRTEKRGQGLRDLEVTFGGVRFTPGHHLYADPDGIVVVPQPLPA